MTKLIEHAQLHSCGFTSSAGLIRHVIHSRLALFRQWGIEDAKIKVPSVENQELSKVLSLKPGVGRHITLHASPAVRK